LSHSKLNIWPLPSWLPPVIRDCVSRYAQAAQTAQFKEEAHNGKKTEIQLAGPLDAQVWHVEELRTRLQRLTTDPRMKSPWGLLNSMPFTESNSGAANGAAARDQFLTDYLTLALAWIAPPIQMLNRAAAPAQQRKALGKVAFHASKLRTLLDSPENLTAYTLWNNLDAAMAFLRASGKTATSEMLTTVERLKRIFVGRTFNIYSDWMPPRAFFACFPAQLDLLVFLADHAATDTQIRSSQAPKTFSAWYIQRLANYVWAHLEQPLDRVIAMTANVALLPPKEFTRQYVEQLMHRHPASHARPRKKNIKN